MTSAPCLDGLDHHHIGDAGGEMGVNLDRDLDRFLDRLDQIIGLVRHQQARHILDTDGVSAGLLDDLGVLDEIVDIVDRAGGVGHRDLDMGALIPFWRP